MAPHSSVCPLPFTLGRTGPHGQCGRVPRHSFLGMGTGPSVSQLNLELEPDGSWWQGGWSVIAAVDAQNACLLLTAVNSRGL